VLTLGVAVLAYLILDARRRGRVTRLTPATPPGERS